MNGRAWLDQKKKKKKHVQSSNSAQDQAQAYKFFLNSSLSKILKPKAQYQALELELKHKHIIKCFNLKKINGFPLVSSGKISQFLNIQKNLMDNKDNVNG